jgi:hypothetical protein
LLYTNNKSESDPLVPFVTTLTWYEQDDKTKVDFCNLQVGSGAFTTLTSPYVDYNEDGAG